MDHMTQILFGAHPGFDTGGWETGIPPPPNKIVTICITNNTHNGKAFLTK